MKETPPPRGGPPGGRKLNNIIVVAQFGICQVVSIVTGMAMRRNGKCLLKEGNMMEPSILTVLLEEVRSREEKDLNDEYFR